MTATRRFAASLAAVAAAVLLFAAHPAAASLAERSDTASVGELSSVKVKEPRSTTAVAALESAERVTADDAEPQVTVNHPAVKAAAPVSKPRFTPRAEQPAKRAYHSRPRPAAAPVRAAALGAAAPGANCHRR